jgi:hypothetical protein
MYKIYKDIGFPALQAFNGMNPERFQELQNAFKLEPFLKSIQELRELDREIENDFNSLIAPNKILAKVAKVKSILDSMKELPKNGEYTDVVSKISGKVKGWEGAILSALSRPML